jgi:tyrosinase
MAVRKKASAMTVAEQNRFKSVITTLINRPGNPNPYGRLVGRHAEDHMMHPFMGPVGTQRFLPWHRVYLLKVERMGQAVDPLFFIPYWKWTTQREVPPWLATFKPTVKVPGSDRTVTRNPPRPMTTLPTSAQITAVLARGTFTSFVAQPTGIDLPHGTVHMWCNGIMSDISWSPVDPLFWLHHAMIDRIWSIWQAAHPGKNPTLAGADRIMDPWPETEAQVRSIAALGYSYGA